MEHILRAHIVPLIPLRVTPNQLSWSRVWGAFVVPVCYLLLHPLVAVAAFAAFTLTDLIDGPLARARNIHEGNGKRLDELSDKALAGGAFLLLFAAGLLPFDKSEWICIAVGFIFFREGLVTTLRGLCKEKASTIPSLPLAKWKTFVMLVAVGMIMMGGAEGAFWQTMADIGRIALYAATALAVISGAQYVWYFVRAR